jgi:hypothetical protein
MATEITYGSRIEFDATEFNDKGDYGPLALADVSLLPETTDNAKLSWSSTGDFGLYVDHKGNRWKVGVGNPTSNEWLSNQLETLENKVMEKIDPNTSYNFPDDAESVIDSLNLLNNDSAKIKYFPNNLSLTWLEVTANSGSNKVNIIFNFTNLAEKDSSKEPNQKYINLSTTQYLTLEANGDGDAGIVINDVNLTNWVNNRPAATATFDSAGSATKNTSILFNQLLAVDRVVGMNYVDSFVANEAWHRDNADKNLHTLVNSQLDTLNNWVNGTHNTMNTDRETTTSSMNGAIKTAHDRANEAWTLANTANAAASSSTSSTIYENRLNSSIVTNLTAASTALQASSAQSSFPTAVQTNLNLAYNSMQILSSTSNLNLHDTEALAPGLEVVSSIAFDQTGRITEIHYRKLP